MPRDNSINWSVGDQMTAARMQAFNTEIDNILTYGSDRGRVVEAASATALKIDLAAFAYRVGQSSGLYTGGTDISVTDAATNYVQIDTTGTIQINTTAWNDSYARLGTVTAAGGVITVIALWKPDVIGGALGGDTSATSTSFTAGETITAGDPLYIKTSDGKAYLTDTSLSDGGKFIGFANEAATSGNSLFINTTGIDGNQVGLTINQDYYLDDGLSGATISTLTSGTWIDILASVVGQTFTLTGDLVYINFYIPSGASGPQTVTINVYDGPSKTTLLGTGNVSVGNFATGWITCNIAISGLNGSYYYEFVTTGLERLGYHTTNPYAGGSMYIGGAIQSANDMSFVIGYDVTPVVGALNSIGTIKVGRGESTTKMLINPGGF